MKEPVERKILDTVFGETPRDRVAYFLYEFILILTFLSLASYIRSTNLLELHLVDRGVLLLVLFVLAFIVESRYLDYVGLFPNILFLNLLAEAYGEGLPGFFYLYVSLGMVLSIAFFILHDQVNDRNLYSKLFTSSRQAGDGVKGRWFFRFVLFMFSFRTLFPMYLTFFLLGSFVHAHFMYAFIFFSLLVWLVSMQSGP